MAEFQKLPDRNRKMWGLGIGDKVKALPHVLGYPRIWGEITWIDRNGFATITGCDHDVHCHNLVKREEKKKE